MTIPDPPASTCRWELLRRLDAGQLEQRSVGRMGQLVIQPRRYTLRFEFLNRSSI
ncbi:MAG: hypothetical protein KJO40_04965 [Deltaproteobacteria bacterium]|nr:hypothetical protein [Deltaproteobacteria bacterium]NND29926.1 hypothetical protein [Myxococcales bacterium]MBT8464771.1 hypothetical protein [Deltaproteobacteria bacterium]MBT8482665.1 hypothetical protein [Deltaproteobacteria bacterium]NNK06698.1 hypothetical protein [Myxococcales bacterium]